MAEKEILTNILKLWFLPLSLWGKQKMLQLSLQNLKTRKMYIKILIFIGPILGGGMEITPSQALIQQGTVLLLLLIRWSQSLPIETTFQKWKK